jgi:hypothetical protein
MRRLAAPPVSLQADLVSVGSVERKPIMQDFLVAVAFLGMLVAPCLIAFRTSRGGDIE